MKVRNGFVSNSSSSSFVIAQKKSGFCEHCGRSDPDISGLIEKSSSSDNMVHENWKDCLCCYDGDEERHKDIIQKAKEYEKKEGWVVIGAEVSYHDEAINSIIKNSKDIVVLYQCD